MERAFPEHFHCPKIDESGQRAECGPIRMLAADVHQVDEKSVIAAVLVEYVVGVSHTASARIERVSVRGQRAPRVAKVMSSARRKKIDAKRAVRHYPAVPTGSTAIRSAGSLGSCGSK